MIVERPALGEAWHVRALGLTPSPLWGEGWGEGGGPIERSLPPHPDPLPKGERGQAELAASFLRHFGRDVL
jgi:hypothetical protein